MIAANLNKRLGKLEATSEAARGVAYILKWSDESPDTAIAKWKAEHGGRDPGADGREVIFLEWGRGT